MIGKYKIKTVSELCGFSPTLLRAWESRHGLLEPVRQPSGHRLYTDDDLRVLRRVSQLLSSGHSIGEIAVVGRLALLAAAGPVVPLPQAPLDSISLDPTALQETVKSVLAAAVALDDRRVRRSLDHLEELLPRPEIVSRVVASIAREMGTMWVNGRATIASEHLLSSLLGERVRHWTSLDAVSPTVPGKVLCASFPDEQHDLGLLALVYELRRTGRDVVNLGSGLPFIDLEAAILTSQPRTVCLSVTRQVTYDVHRHSFREVVQRHPAVAFVVGGGGIAHLEDDLVYMGVTGWPVHRPLTELSEAMT